MQRMKPSSRKGSSETAGSKRCLASVDCLPGDSLGVACYAERTPPPPSLSRDSYRDDYEDSERGDDDYKDHRGVLDSIQSDD